MTVAGERFDFSWMGESVQVEVVAVTKRQVRVELLSGSNVGKVRTMTLQQAENSLIPMAVE